MNSVKGNLNNGFFVGRKKYDCLHRVQSINQYGEASFVETPFTITASIQPTSGRELDFMPESALLTDNITIFSKEELKNAPYGDIVIYGGMRYQVSKVKKWQTHWESIATMEANNG
jgi:hypothetical protein